MKPPKPYTHDSSMLFMPPDTQELYPSGYMVRHTARLSHTDSNYNIPMPTCAIANHKKTPPNAVGLYHLEGSCLCMNLHTSVCKPCICCRQHANDPPAQSDVQQFMPGVSAKGSSSCQKGQLSRHVCAVHYRCTHVAV